MDKSEREVVGLRYEPGSESAPEVTLRGRGEMAERILMAAEEHGVPIRKDADLVQLLGIARLGEEIPVEVFGAVARLLTFLYELNEDQRRAEANARD